MRLPVFLAACTTAVAVAGCNSSRQTGPVIDPPGPSRPEASAAGPSLPQGAACTGAISRYRSVMENRRRRRLRRGRGREGRRAPARLEGAARLSSRVRRPKRSENPIGMRALSRVILETIQTSAFDGRAAGA